MCSCTRALATDTQLPASQPGSDWNRAFATYARDPYHNRSALLALRRYQSADLHPLYLLSLADAQLRARQYTAARRSFNKALDRGVPQPFAGWAQLGLGWTAMASGDSAEACIHFADVAGTDTPSAPLGAFAAALIDAAEERPGVLDRFLDIATDDHATPAVAQAARLGAAYARYWAQDYDGAADAFDAVASDDPEGRFADDARYGAAWSRVHAGRTASGATALRALMSHDAGRRGAEGPMSHELVNLEPQAVVRAAFQRYRRGPLAVPEEEIAGILDADGVAFARVALHWLDGGGATPPRAPLTAMRARREGGAWRLASERDAMLTSAARGSEGTSDRRDPWLPVLGLVAVAVAIGMLWLARGRQIVLSGRR